MWRRWLCEAENEEGKWRRYDGDDESCHGGFEWKLEKKGRHRNVLTLCDSDDAKVLDGEFRCKNSIFPVSLCDSQCVDMEQRVRRFLFCHLKSETSSSWEHFVVTFYALRSVKKYWFTLCFGLDSRLDSALWRSCEWDNKELTSGRLKFLLSITCIKLMWETDTGFCKLDQLFWSFSYHSWDLK